MNNTPPANPERIRDIYKYITFVARAIKTKAIRVGVDPIIKSHLRPIRSASHPDDKPPNIPARYIIELIVDTSIVVNGPLGNGVSAESKSGIVGDAHPTIDEYIMVGIFAQTLAKNCRNTPTLDVFIIQNLFI